MALSWLALLLSAALPVGAQLLFEPLATHWQRSEDLTAKGGRLPDGTADSVAAGEFPTGLQQPTLCDANVTQYSGRLDAGPGVRYFFWFFESRSSPSTDPVVMWLSGGPGCSSQLALLALNGPCSVSQDGLSTIPNPYSWTQRANVLWLDQPSSTGFSEGPRPRGGTEEAADNVYLFLKNFYRELPRYLSNDFYVFGESYAGHYVPAVAHHIWEQRRSGDLVIPLRGLGIGNGLTHPEEQFKWYPSMARDGGLSEGGTLNRTVMETLMTSQDILESMQASVQPCVGLIRACNAADSSDACLIAYSVCTTTMLTPYQMTGFNLYDMRIACEVPGLCYDFDRISVFLNLPETQKQLGVLGRHWGSCNSRVNGAFQADWMRGFHTKLPELLGDGIRVLVYAGDVDYICNWLGNKKWTLALDWEHKAAFNAAGDLDYVAAGRNAGRIRSANGFTFLQVFQAGHMVPMDQPEVAQVMLDDFVSGRIAPRPDVPPRLI